MSSLKTFESVDKRSKQWIIKKKNNMGKKKVKEVDTPSKEEFDPVELITKKPQTVILMLQSTEEAVLQTVCEALFKYAEKSPENKAQMINLGALQYLISLISHEDKMVKKAAVMCIGSAASEPSARKIMRNSNCIHPLLKLLSPEEEIVCHEFSTLALSYLAEEYSSKLEIFEKQGLQLLLNHLLSSDCDVQKNAVQTVALLVQEFQNRAAMKDLNGLEPLFKLLDSEYAIIQELALDALITCSENAENRAAVRDLDGLSKLVDIIGTANLSDLHILCLKCLAACLEDTESLKLIQTTGVFEKLLAYITEPSTSPEIQQFAVLVIAAACKQDENRRIFHEQNTEKTLISLLSSESILVINSCVKALAALAEDFSSRDRIGKSDGIPPIIKLLSNDNMETRELASLALANLTNSNTTNCQICMDKNTVDPLIKLLSDKRNTTQSNAAVCLSNLALNEAWRVEIKKHGLVKGLIETLKSNNPDVQLSGCQALAAFLCDIDIRQQLLQVENGISLLLDLLKSANGAVRRNASWVISLCSADTDLAEEITNNGGLDILQALNLSSQRNPFTEMAFERMLNTNLSAKYCITGSLKFDNVIDNIFYDIGKIREDSRFFTLYELYEQDINQNRPVIFVNPKKCAKKQSKEENKPIQQKTLNAEKSVEKRGKSKNERRSSKLKLSKDNREETKDTTASDKPEIQTNEVIPEYGQTLANVTDDNSLLSMINEVQSDVGSIDSTEEQIRALASYVNEQMGGSVLKDEITSFSYELHISDLKRELSSNVIPIGKIKQGIYYHRALLFKVLADSIGLPCTLVRGDYGRAWNEIQLIQLSENGQPVLPPKLFIVDLMHYPGDLLVAGSPQAVCYQRI